MPTTRGQTPKKRVRGARFFQSPRERLLALGAEPGGGTPEQLAAYIAREIPKWAKIVKAAKIRGE